MGNLIYILNDGNAFYTLLVPNEKLSGNVSDQILKLNGWVEKFTQTNYHKSCDLYSVDTITKEVNYILTEILKTPATRKWRFETNPGMMVVKAEEISLNAATRREINQKNANSPLKMLTKYLLIPFSTNLRMAITFTIACTTIYFFNQRFFDLKSFLLIPGLGLLCYLLLKLKYPEHK